MNILNRAITHQAKYIYSRKMSTYGCVVETYNDTNQNVRAVQQETLCALDTIFFLIKWKNLLFINIF